MRVISPLPRLPLEAVDLVNAGVYSLYVLADHPFAYLLVADNGGTFYWLDADGEIMDAEHDARFHFPMRSQLVDVARFEERAH